MDFLKWYKSKIESGNEDPPEELWDDIQNELDIDLVYQRLEKSLQKDRRKIWLSRASVAAGFLLLFSLGAIYFLTSDMPESQMAEQNNQNEPKDSINQVLVPGVRITSPIEKMVKLPANTEFYSTKDTKHTLATDTSRLLVANLHLSSDTINYETDISPIARLEEEFSLNLSSDDFVLPQPEFVPDNSDLALTSFDSEPEPLDSSEEIINKQSGLFSKITIAATSEFANTWLLNQKTLEGMNPSEFTATRPTFTNNFGVSVAASLTENWELVSLFSLSRENGQNYNEYLQGKYVSNRISLEYIDVALSARYRPFRKNRNHSFSAGMYSAFLENASQIIDGETISVASEYTDTDFGFLAGYEYQTPVSSHLTLGAGVFYRMGIKNIFEGNNRITSNLNHSLNTSFNFSLSVGYSFSL